MHRELTPLRALWANIGCWTESGGGWTPGGGERPVCWSSPGNWVSQTDTSKSSHPQPSGSALGMRSKACPGVACHATRGAQPTPHTYACQPAWIPSLAEETSLTTSPISQASPGGPRAAGSQGGWGEAPRLQPWLPCDEWTCPEGGWQRDSPACERGPLGRSPHPSLHRGNRWLAAPLRGVSHPGPRTPRGATPGLAQCASS